MIRAIKHPPRSPAESLQAPTQLEIRCAIAVRGMTLIELLIAVSIIGVLSSLLLPSLSRAKSAAQRVRCISNLHQLGIATQLYWDDHDSLAFRYREGSTNNGDVYWFGWLERGSEGDRRVDHRQGMLYPYLAGRGVEICPSLRYGSPNFKLKASGAAYGYGYNMALSPTSSKPRINVRNLSSPTETALFADAAQVNDFQAPASKDHPMLEEFYYVTPREATVHFRHQARANVVFADGHVGTEEPTAGSIDTRLPAELVGRLRAEVLMTR